MSSPAIGRSPLRSRSSRFSCRCVSAAISVQPSIAALPLIVVGWSTRYLFRRVLHAARENGRFMMRTLLVGDPMTVDQAASAVLAMLTSPVWLRAVTAVSDPAGR